MPYSEIEAKSIQDLCRIIDCEHKTAPYVRKSQFLVIRTSNVRNGQLVMQDMKFTTQAGYEEWTQRAIPQFGDVLFTREAPAGESCLVPEDKKICMGQRMVMLRPNKKKIDPVYLSFILASAKCKFDISRLSIGSTVSRINISDIKKLKVAVPPISEQKKIAQLLSTWDKAITTTEQLLANSQQQKKALMQQLLTGNKRLRDDNGTRFSGEWRKVKLGTVADMNSGGTPKSSVDEYYGGDIPWVSIADMTKRGKWISSTEKYLTPLGLENSSARIYPINTILYAMYASIGECSIAQVPVSSSQAILGIRTKEALDYEFLYFFLSSLKKKIKLQGQQGTQSNLNAGMVKSFIVHLPSLEEQKKIATVLSNADNEIFALQEKRDSLKQEKKALMQQLLTGKRRVKVKEEAA